ncbi:Ragulator complex protein LAMTOR3 [Trichinella nativa]|uniref:Ragulator complex protein LAMTOR3 n=5 Tax=Trichinella TaxID=6333 RepID=A0A0V1KYN5_9BILA|nr:Ragulator complex protein LAMTOR3 [Trichinella nativa]
MNNLQKLQQHVIELASHVDQLHEVIFTDLDGVPILRCSIDNSAEMSIKTQFLASKALSTEKNRSRVLYAHDTQVQFTRRPIVRQMRVDCMMWILLDQPSTGNQQKIVYRGRCYTLKRTNRNDKCWICASGSRGCSGKLYTNLDATEVIRTGEHAEGCRVDAHAFYHQQQLNELKRLAAGDPRPVLEIYDELASNASTSLETAAYFPTWEQARNTMYYSRSKRYPRLPARRQDLRLTAEQTTTKSGAQFLMYHSPTNDILIFATEDGVKLLAQSNCWCGDGTFKIVPSWYQQLFTLHVFLRGKLLPVVYCLTVRKDLPTYSRIFEVLHSKAEELGVQLEPAKFVCDFETALIPAIQGNFPNTRVQGCFFHFCQAVLRQVGRLGLRTDYMNNQEVRKKVKMLMALAFLPVHLVPAGFEIINVGTSGQLEALFQYFQREWLPAATIPLWNVHGVSVRTNNHLEGWHSRMNKRARKHHLGFYQFLQLILDEQGKTETVVRQIDDGYTHGRGSVRRSAAYGVQQRRVAALTGVRYRILSPPAQLSSFLCFASAMVGRATTSWLCLLGCLANNLD